MFYSNGVDSYEVGVLKGGTLCYDTPITNDVIGYIPAAEVSDIMRKIQELPNSKQNKYEWKRCTKTIADQLRFLP